MLPGTGSSNVPFVPFKAPSHTFDFGRMWSSKTVDLNYIVANVRLAQVIQIHIKGKLQTIFIIWS